MTGQEPAEGETHQGNWYVLVMGLPQPKSPLTLAPGLTLVPLRRLRIPMSYPGTTPSIARGLHRLC